MAWQGETVIPKRTYGRTGEKLSIIGLGGILVAGASPAQAGKMVDEAIQKGVNYVDVAPTYGNAEELLGPALRGYRDDIFLACKTIQRTRKEASKELRHSLLKLQTDRFDLYQFHGINSVQEVDTIFGPGGAMEAFLEARKMGLVSHIGFSAHSVKTALECMDRFDFDSILFPVNFVLYEKENFGPQVIKKALERGTSCLAIKSIAKTKWAPGAKKEAFPKCWYEPASDPRTAELLLRFTLSQPVVAAIPPGEERLFRMALEIGSRFKPITDKELGELREMARAQEPIFRLDI